MTKIELTPIGHVRGGRAEPIDDAWDSVEAEIVLDAEIQTGARHPRGRKDWPLVGIFAQRGKGRPNRIGITICRLLSVDGLTLRVRGLDAIDGTPVIDIKPVMKGFLPRGDIREPAWAGELMRDYW